MAEQTEHLIIRKLSAVDKDLAAIATELNSDDWEEFDHLDSDFTEASLKNFLQVPTNFYFVELVNNKVVGAVHGYVHLHPAGPTYVYVDEVDTALSYRRKGAATRIMKQVFAMAKDLEADEVWLGTEHDNTSAKALYESLNPDEIENGPTYVYKLKAK